MQFLAPQSVVRLALRVEECGPLIGLISFYGVVKDLAGALRGQAVEGVGRHWWRQLAARDVTDCQLPDPAGGYSRPAGW